MVRYSSTCRAFGPDGSADKLRSKIHLKPPMKIKKLELAASLAYSYYTCTNLFPGFSLLHVPALSDKVSDRVLRSRVSHSPLKKPLCGLCPASVCGIVTGDALVIYWQFFPWSLVTLPEVFANVKSVQLPSGRRETLGTIKVTILSMPHNEHVFLVTL